MKAEELFIDAIVRVNHGGLCIKKNTIVEVRAVDADDKLIEKGLVGSAHCRPLDDDQFEGGIWCEYLEPIPLTPEILEKNGFQKQAGEIWEYDIFSKDNGLMSMIVWRRDYATPHLSIRSFTLQYGEYSRRDAKYIHQLQHAFHLCGIEKEIEL